MQATISIHYLHNHIRSKCCCYILLRFTGREGEAQKVLSDLPRLHSWQSGELEFGPKYYQATLYSEIKREESSKLYCYWTHALVIKYLCHYNSVDLHRPLPLVWSGGLDLQKGAHVSHKPFQKWAQLKLKFTHGGSHTLSFTLQQWEQNPTQIIGNTRMQGSRIFLFLQLLGRQHRGGWAAWPSTSYKAA